LRFDRFWLILSSYKKEERGRRESEGKRNLPSLSVHEEGRRRGGGGRGEEESRRKCILQLRHRGVQLLAYNSFSKEGKGKEERRKGKKEPLRSAPCLSGVNQISEGKKGGEERTTKRKMSPLRAAASPHPVAGKISSH